MAEWQTLPLGEALTFQRGFDITKDEQRDGPYPVISSSGPKTTHAEYKVRGPGVVIGRKGSLGTVFYSESDYWPHDTTLWIKDFHGNHPRFAYYFLQTMGFERLDAGASNPSLNRNHIHTIPVRWPSLLVQQRIASILSAYDELIENCHRRIWILESMAQSLYREWFVNFKFPGHEKVPRVASALGDIPKGWETNCIGDIFKTVLGGTPSRVKPEFWEDGTVPWINSGKVNDLRITEASEHITLLALKKSAAKIMPKGTTVLAITGATLGQVSYLEIETAANQSVVGIVDPSDLRSEWIYLTIRERIEGIIKHASGGAQQHINKEIVSDVQVVLAPDSLAKDFKLLVAPMFQELATLLFQIQNLRRTRDLLLPRLLSCPVNFVRVQA